MPRRFRTPASLFLALALSAAHFSAQSGPVTYVYDELGRLVGVIDGAGEAAIYTYDAVGNLLSITRKTATQVSIIEFTPNSGGVGATVTIQGTGFSTTPASNTVQFNGTTATVTSASANKLVTTVPTGATTGPISVTTPNGSATSTQSFTVAAALVPTITSFTPAIGVAGVQVTINGSNFETIAASNRVKLGVARAGLVSATATVLTATVPALTGSGKIAVATPVGQAVSTADFYVPPSPYTAADVVFTDRLQFAQSKAVPIATATKIGLVIFDANQSQRVSLKVAPGPLTNASIHKPDGSLLVSGSTGLSPILLEPPLLPATGTYTANIDPIGNGTGTTTVTLYDVPADVTGTITPGGASQTASLNTPGQNALYAFSGTAGQRVSLKVDAGAPSGTVSIKKPDGSTLASTPSGISTGFIDATALPTTGTYTVFVDPSQANTGNTTVTLYDVPADITGTITAGGAPVTVTITTPGQNATLTFSGTTGQRVSLKVNASAPVGTVSILNPDGSTLGSTSSGFAAGFIDTKTLIATGTHTVKIDPSTVNTGSVTVTLYDVPADVTGTITIGGASVGVAITTPGQNGSLTFTGASGQQVTVRLTNNTMSTVTVKLLKPDGGQLTSSISSLASFNLSTQTLPVNGTYTISIDPSQWNTGSITVAVTSP